MFKIYCIICLLLLCSCSTSERETVIKGEYLYRLHNEFLFKTEAPVKKNLDCYAWENDTFGHLPKISKEYFRCKGSSLNPVRFKALKEGEPERLHDCGGTDKHSLPLRKGKEFVYPILLELLNAIQQKTFKRVVITCGHRCPEHNSYADPLQTARYSKHMIGAEVSFYVQGLEDRPESIVGIIQDFYKNSPLYANKKEYTEFKRYDKGDTDVATSPWYNKEIFLKIYKKYEGRDFDNRHPFPYITIQVRYDRELGEKVIYSWEKAHHNFLRK